MADFNILVDKRTELNGKAMEKLVNDPSPLYRDIRVAPGTREQIDARRKCDISTFIILHRILLLHDLSQ